MSANGQRDVGVGQVISALEQARDTLRMLKEEQITSESIPTLRLESSLLRNELARLAVKLAYRRFDLQHLSNDDLPRPHSAILACRNVDDAIPSGDKPFGVREHADWKIHADQFEAEMARRRIKFQPIGW